MLVEILNQNKSITPSATNVLGKTKNGNNSSKSLSDLVKTEKTVTNAKNKFKKKRGSAQETGAEETEAFDDLDLGKVVYDYNKLLNDFEVKIISSQIPDDNEIDKNESKAEMRFNKISKDDVDSTGSICETYQVANTFGIRGSKGYIVFFNNQLSASSNISVESMLELKDNMEIIFENDLTVKEQEQQTEIICHVRIIAAKPIMIETGASATVAAVETPNPNPNPNPIIDNELIRALVNYLLTGASLEPEDLRDLPLLKVFTILVGIAPEQSLNEPFIARTVNRDLYKSQALIVSNVFCLPGIEGLSIIKYQDDISLLPASTFESSENYKNGLKDLKFNQFSTSRLELKNDLNFTVYFGTNMNDDGLHALISNNLIEICQAMIDGAWISKFHSFWYSDSENAYQKYLSQLKESSYAFLFLFDGDEYFNLDSIKGFNEDLVKEEKDIISSAEINSHTIAESFHLKNLAGDSTLQGYQFVLKQKDYSSVFEKEFINEFTCSEYQFIVKGLNLEESEEVADLITRFINNQSSDKLSLAQNWIEICKTTKGVLYNQYYLFSTAKPIDILLWKKF